MPAILRGVSYDKRNKDALSEAAQSTGEFMKSWIVLSAAALLTACGNDLPASYNYNGVEVQVIGKGWTPDGDQLLVRDMHCPWKSGAMAVIRISGRHQSQENICLVFDDDAVREAYYNGGSLPFRALEMEWAEGWPR
jgi:hypothetical protein